jgi:hypothetical protein
MSVQPRRRRRSGSLSALKSALWACIAYNLEVIDDKTLEHDLRQRACNSLTQAALAYSRIVELYDLEREVKALEQLSHSNGHLPG